MYEKSDTTDAGIEQLVRCHIDVPAGMPAKPSDVAGAPARDQHEDTDWVQATLSSAVAWREDARGLFVRWVAADRALRVATAGCSDIEGTFDIDGIRWDGHQFNRTTLASWGAWHAEHEHARSSEMVTRLVMRELISLIEASVFDAYELFLSQNPSDILDKPENLGLKRLYTRRFDKPANWQKSWKSQMRRSREEWALHGFGKVMERYWSAADLALPEGYDAMTLANLSATMSLLLEMRAHITCSSSHVSPSLARLGDLVDSTHFRYEAGKPFTVDAKQMEVVEAFFQAYLQLLGRALEER